MAHAARAGSAECLEGLAQAMLAFSEATGDPARLYTQVAEHAARLTRDLTVVMLLAPGGDALQPVALHGPDAALLQKSRDAIHRPFALERHPIVRQVLETGLPFVFSRAMLGKLSPPITTEGFARWLREGGIQGLLLVPLSVRERRLGMLAFARADEGAPFTPEDLRFAQALSAHAALAIANHALAEDRQRQIDEARRQLVERQRMAERLKLLSDSAREFSAATGDLPALLDSIARRLGETLGDLCALRTVSRDGTRLEKEGALWHRDPAVVAAARAESKEAEEADPVDARKLPREAIFMPQADAERWTAGRGGRYQKLLGRIGVSSAIALPLLCRGELVGKVNLIRCAGGAPYTEDDLRLAQGIADHAGLALGNARSYEAERSARAAADEARLDLAESEARHQLVFDHSPAPMYVIDGHSNEILEVNEAAARLYRYSRAEMAGLDVSGLLAPGVKAIDLSRFAVGESTPLGLRRHQRKDGGLLSVEVTLHSMVLSGRLVRVVSLVDLTERLSLAEQLRQAQKMEAIGRLAGGVAHDFNNLLSVIGSYGEIASAETAGTQVGEDIEQIRHAARRAAALTRQLLAFSRQQVLESQVLDLGELLSGMGPMLQRMVGEDIELGVRCATSLARVRADPGSLEQVIMNLVVNARDAMPTGGKLTLEVEEAPLDEEYAREHLGVTPGPHVMLSVTDSGQGMDRATQERIFEPFFTTKEKGKGTGLGLSTVFGIVQQSGGHVWVYSEPGQGTTFKIYLPIAEGEPERARPLAARRAKGTETLLVVEDDDLVRAAAGRILKRSGYRVLEASGAEEALGLVARHPEPIDLLLTDVVMPQMSGPALASRLEQERPGLRVLFMSGYTGESVVRHGLISPGAAYLAKPLTNESLSQRVRTILDEPRVAAG